MCGGVNVSDVRSHDGGVVMKGFEVRCEVNGEVKVRMCFHSSSPDCPCCCYRW